ncbi:MAG: SRPBCC family protein [Myxococcota bacterium]
MIETLPASWYRDPHQYHRERQMIFGRHWLVAAHESQLPSPQGAMAVTVAGWSLLLVRDQDTIRGFHNVCRHRAAPLVWDGEAAACAQLRCRYHGWRYALDGRLTHTANFGEAFDPDEWGLHPIHVAVWRGMVFVNLSDSMAPPPLEDALTGLREAAASLPLESMRAWKTARHRLRADWKTYVENYLEGYHIAWMHPGLTREISLRDYTVAVDGRAAVHRVPTKPGAISQGFWAWLWPNVALNVYGDGMSIERMNPLGPGECEIVYTYLFPPGRPAQEMEESIALSGAVTAEDVQICEAVQRNLDAGVYDTGRLSPRHENGVAAFQRWVRSALAATDQPDKAEQKRADAKA